MGSLDKILSKTWEKENIVDFVTIKIRYNDALYIN